MGIRWKICAQCERWRRIGKSKKRCKSCRQGRDLKFPPKETLDQQFDRALAKER